jgi:tight adherence protein B
MAKKVRAPKYMKTPLNNRMLNYGTYEFSGFERIVVYLVAFSLGGLTGLVFYGGLFQLDGVTTTATNISDAAFFCVLGVIGARFLVPMYRASALGKRRKRLKLQFRDMLESLASSFSAGSNVLGAFTAALTDLKIQYEQSDFIVKEMQQIIDGANQGIGIDVMLRDFAKRSHDEDVLSFADVFETCYRKGGNMQTIIISTHNVIGEKIAVLLEIQTKLTSNQMQHNVMSIMPIAIVLLLKTTNPSFAENLASPLGVVVNTIAIGIFLAAYRYGRKIVNIKT